MRCFIKIFFIIFYIYNFNYLLSTNLDKEQIINQFQVDSVDISGWRKVQEQAQDTVVQLFVETMIFNWLDPYKSPEQKAFYGSGFLIDEDGYIVTNYHVIEQAVSVKIQIPSFGKKRFKTDIIGVCPDRDIALLQLSKKSRNVIKDKLGKIPYLKLGNSDKVLRTQEILAMGYPLGQEKLKSTQGIVSGREYVWGELYIQITAALNKGNSGGPSFNSKGEVIGINTVGISRAQNVGYIIPINDVESVIKDLYKIKFLRYPMLGAEFNYANDEMLDFFNNPKPGGLYLSRIYKDSLLNKNNVKEGDMLYSLNGYKLDLYGEILVPWSEDKVSIVSLLNRYPIGKQINLIVYRNGTKKEFTFEFNLVDPLPIRRIYTPFEKVDYEIIGGMVVMELKLNHLDFLLKEDAFLIKYKKRENQYESRLIITHVFPDSPVQKARVLGVTDLLEEVNNQKVRTLNDFRHAIQNGKNKKFLTVKSEDKRFMVLSIENILKEEKDLSKKYLYKMSKLIDYLEDTIKIPVSLHDDNNNNGKETELDENEIKNKKDIDKKFTVIIT
ncbi:trypsin-like serine protease [Candidatus Dependentiae bacterium]|nr:trypsin-like serine protease [Candidatus Dependentiae bacterium]